MRDLFQSASRACIFKVTLLSKVKQFTGNPMNGQSFEYLLGVVGFLADLKVRFGLSLLEGWNYISTWDSRLLSYQSEPLNKSPVAIKGSALIFHNPLEPLN